MTTKQPLASLLLSALTALGATACAPGIDVGQATGTGSSSNSGGTTTGGIIDSGSLLPFLEITPNPVDFGTLVVNTSETRTVTVDNKSSTAVSGITATVTGAFPSQFTVLNMPTFLAANSQATVDIQFSPVLSSEHFQGSITISAPGYEPFEITLDATVAQGAIEIETTPLEFGYVPLLSTVVECSPLTNQANVAVTITGVNSFESAGSSFALATTDDSSPPNPFSLPITIPAGGTGKVCFSFTPPITQQYDGHASLMTDDPSGTNPIIQLNGWGGGPQITCSPLNLVFDADAGFGPMPVTCMNIGTAIPGVNLLIDLPMASPAAFTAEFDQSVDQYPLGGLAPGQSAAIDVTYQPLVDAGTTGTLIINSNGGQGQPVVIPLAVSGS